MYTLHVGLGHILQVRTNTTLLSSFWIPCHSPALPRGCSTASLLSTVTSLRSSLGLLCCAVLCLYWVSLSSSGLKRGRATLVLLTSFLPPYLLNELDTCTLSLYFFHSFVCFGASYSNSPGWPVSVSHVLGFHLVCLSSFHIPHS